MSAKKDTAWLINKSKSIFSDLFDYSKTQYVDAKTQIEFKCKKHNYIFFQKSNNHFYSKHPCKFCLEEHKRASFSDGLELFKSKIFEKFGDSFSFEKAKYVNQRTKLCLTCKRHNIDVIKEPQVFLRGHGCEKCSDERYTSERSEDTLIEINEFVSRLNGKCLSKEYSNNEEKLEFQCEEGHVFSKSWSAVNNSLRWCPKCSPNKLVGETLTRLILEHLLSMELPSQYLEEMEGLQLDGFSAENKIAFEYQGYQHYTKKSHFHISNNQYLSQKKRDQRKKELCDKNGITLIEIIEFKTIRAGRIELFTNLVKEKLTELGLQFNQKPFVLDLVQLYEGRKSRLYGKAKKIVESKDSIIQEYIGSESKHYYICPEGHKVNNRTLDVIVRSKASCPICIDHEKYLTLYNTIKDRGGRLINDKLKPRGYSELYDWICDEGHKNKTKGAYLKSGHWCKKCQAVNSRITFEKDMLDSIISDVTSGRYYQKDLLSKWKLSDTVYRRILKEKEITPSYLPQDRKAQKKRIKGKLLQLDPITHNIIKEFESLESVKHDPSGLFKPEGIRHQMKKNKKAYGFYWCRENDYQTVKDLLNNKS